MESNVMGFINFVFQIYRFLIIGYVLLSWFPNARESFIGQFLGKVVEPYLSIFRRFIPPLGGVLDLSPIIAIFALVFIELGLAQIVEIIFKLG